MRLNGDVPVPERVWLIVISTGAAYDSSVAWRTATELGLQFLSAADLTNPTAAHYLRRLWLDSTAR